MLFEPLRLWRRPDLLATAVTDLSSADGSRYGPPPAR